ncbi:predicted protein [Uncinocarpus reesii 1704]|uniref:Calcineurin-like phosphoesterase domain-containing protein n=1 Tax=Uncinocarpus reesii (strain UAMH 1704) TaxID=336963 RepID=C4JHA8_UNCRE|nr:uncharacterized protein UREG_02681 [Uncinocarpus reesii 1704]EEP77832.1 predicted protein [Uncinocarpus reesii 1704]
MEFQILSDLHLETPASYDIFDIPPKAPHLALLGDIGNVRDEGFFLFLEAQLRQFHTVFFVLGNHEPFHSSWAEARNLILEFSTDVAVRADAEGLGEFVFLDQTRYDVSNDLTILGCTLYSHVPPEHEEDVRCGLNDFYQIDDWTVEAHNAAHAANVKWLNEQVLSISRSEPGRRIVILTHHSPIIDDPRVIDPAHADSPILSGFATNMKGEECWKNANVIMWTFGHTHFNCDFTVDDEKATRKRIFSNQRGYYFKQAAGFDVTNVVNA